MLEISPVLIANARVATFDIESELTKVNPNIKQIKYS